jgi:hypothetical protein
MSHGTKDQVSVLDSTDDSSSRYRHVSWPHRQHMTFAFVHELDGDSDTLGRCHYGCSAVPTGDDLNS